MEYSSVLKENRQRPKVQTSPLMFESDEEDETETVDDSANSSNKENSEESIKSVVEPSKEERILKGFQTVLMGIPPPPAFTVPQLDCREILKLWREHQSLRVTFSPEKCESNKSISKQLENEAKSTNWPDTLQLDYWDVYYNRSLSSEELERLSIRYKERYVGAETSSCINALFAKSPLRTASARKRARHRAWGHSPGRRLSHLARRRKAFSSASLCSVAGNKNPDKKMIMVEIKKIGNRQKKKGSAKKTKPTPKKKNETQSSTFKRALFQSPDQDPMNAASKTPNTQCIQRSKRNLFAGSSEKKNEFGKRERPVPKRVSPRKKVNRSLSFQESWQPSTPPRVAPPPAVTTNQLQPLNGAHKQKMLWAATNALREEGMGMSHELFRPCMTVLFRTCQRLWLTRAAGLQDTEGSTSERMLALAKRFSPYVIREISSDPTSEHMALVYNNSLKMAEAMFNQPGSSGVSSSNCGNPKDSSSDSKNVYSDCNKQNTKEVGTKGPILVSGRSVNCDINKTLVDSSVVTKDTNSARDKTETPVKSKTSENTSSKVSSLQLFSKQTSSLKNTPSKVSCRDSLRSSPRIAKRTALDSKVKSSVCNALFPTERHDQPPETVSRVDGSNKQNINKDCKISPSGRKKDQNINRDCEISPSGRKKDQNINRDCKISPSGSKKDNTVSSEGGKLEFDLPSQSCLERRTPSKRALSVIGAPKSTCTNLSELGETSSVVRPNIVNISSRISGDIEKNNKIIGSCSVNLVNIGVCSNLRNKDDCGVGSKSFAIESCLRLTKSGPQDCQTPTKKVSFSTISPPKSTKVNPRRPSCEVKNNNLFSPSNTNCKKKESEIDSCKNSIVKNIVSSADYRITESFAGRRITRSVSIDTEEKTKKQIHHLFSPPTHTLKSTRKNKVSNKEVTKQVTQILHQSNISEALTNLQHDSSGEDLIRVEPRVTRKASSDLNSKMSLVPGSTIGEDSNTPHMSVHVKQSDSISSEHFKRCLVSTKSPKKRTTCKISQDAESIRPVVNTVSSCSSKNKVDHSEPPSSPEFISPRTRSRKTKSNKITPDKSKSSADKVSEETQLTRATLNRRSSVLSCDSSSFKDSPDKSVFSEEYSADTENSSGTLISGKSLSQKSSLTEDFNEENETNKENLTEERTVTSEKGVERHSSHTQLLSVENTPTNQVVAEEPVNRMLQLYRLSTSGGNDMETEKLLPDIVCLEPPKLAPHWAADESESEDSALRTSPPSLTPHWEQESCSGTSVSLPESIMAHWHQLSTKENEQSSDKVMFDFEETSYEITFPSANEDSRASSICAFDFPFPIDDSKSGFHSVFRRSSTESSN